MRQRLRIIALVLALATVGFWVTTGANRGWTKTSVPVKTMDTVTGIEGVEYHKRFVPGLDFLGGALLGAGALAAASLVRPNKHTTQTYP